MTNQRATARDRLSALILIATPVVLGVGLVVHPRETSNETTQLGIVARHASAWGAAHVLIYLGAALCVGAVVALVRLGDRHHAKGVLVAGAFAGFGAVALAATAAVELVTRHVVQAGLTQTSTTAVVHRYQSATDLGVAVFAAGFALSLGLAALALTLWRSGALPGWAALGLALGALTAPLPIVAVRDFGAIVLLIGMARAAHVTQQRAADTSVANNDARAVPTTADLLPGRA